MGLLTHEDTYPCPHSGCDGEIVLEKSNVFGTIKGIKHNP